MMHFKPALKLKDDRDFITSLFAKEGFVPALISKTMQEYRDALSEQGFHFLGSMHFKKDGSAKLKALGGVYEVSIFWGGEGKTDDAKVVGVFRLNRSDIECPANPLSMSYGEFKRIMKSSHDKGMDGYLRRVLDNFLMAPLPVGRKPAKTQPEAYQI